MKRYLKKGLPLACLVAAAVMAQPTMAVTPGAGAQGGDARSSDPAYDQQPGASSSSRTGSSSMAMSDSAITAKVKSALLTARDIPSNQIKVETTNGIVQLSGFLNSQDEIDRAVSITRNVSDVRGVENNMQMK